MGECTQHYAFTSVSPPDSASTAFPPQRQGEKERESECALSQFFLHHSIFSPSSCFLSSGAHVLLFSMTVIPCCETVSQVTTRQEKKQTGKRELHAKKLHASCLMLHVLPLSSPTLYF